jgi:hypothetical protein
MNIRQFIKKIPPVILERGEDYYHQGAITDLNRNTHGTWIAEVEGNYDDYVVEIETNEKGEIEDYYCNCPYDGAICKHIAAVTLKLDEEGLITKAKNKKDSLLESSWQQMVNNADAGELREFIIDFASHDKNLRHEIKLRFAKPESGPQKDNMAFYQAQISACFDRYERHGYIDYNAAFQATSHVEDFLTKAENYLKKGHPEEAFGIAAAIVIESSIAIQNMDDSSGQCGGIIYGALKIIETILTENKSPELNQSIFNWLKEEAKNPDYSNYGIDELEPLYFNTAIMHKKFNDAHALINNNLQELITTDSWTKNYYTTKYLQYKIELLKAEGKSEEALQIVEENIHLNDFRKIKARQLIEEKKYDEAEQCIHAGIAQSRKEGYFGLETDWHKQLLELYITTNDKIRQLEVTRWLFKGESGNRTEHLKNLKKLLAKKDWPAERDELISWTRKNDEYYLFKFYEFEGMKAELFDLLKKRPSFNQLRNYESLLMDDYADEFLELYRISLNQIAERSSSRGQYAELARNLKLVKKLNGGENLVRILLASYRDIYKRRRAMMEELSAV